MMEGEYWQRDDLLARLRMEASINQGNAKLCGEAADEIERLRLTEAERSAIGVAIQCVEAAMAQRHPEEEDARDLLHKTSCTLSRLFDRMSL